MIVAASSSCIPDAPLSEVFDRLADLEYTNTELVIGERGVISLATIESQFDGIVQVCRMSRHATPVSVYFDLEPEHPDYYELFETVCKLAKSIKVANVTIHASEPGAAFNEEIDRLKKIVSIAMQHGVVVGAATEAGRVSEEPTYVLSLCKSIKGLGVTLDPSHYVYNLPRPKEYECLLPYVTFVRLRDTSMSQFQVRVGQGIIDFGRLIALLRTAEYRGALCVDLVHLPDLDPFSELRKMRFLLESSL